MTETFQLFVGIDWATEAHQVCALNPHGEIPGSAVCFIPGQPSATW